MKKLIIALLAVLLCASVFASDTIVSVTGNYLLRKIGTDSERGFGGAAHIDYAKDNGMVFGLDLGADLLKKTAEKKNKVGEAFAYAKIGSCFPVSGDNMFGFIEAKAGVCYNVDDGKKVFLPAVGLAGGLDYYFTEHVGMVLDADLSYTPKMGANAEDILRIGVNLGAVYSF